jgi:hypothetical protein
MLPIDRNHVRFTTASSGGLDAEMHAQALVRTLPGAARLVGTGTAVR